MSDKNSSIDVLFTRQEIQEIDELISVNMDTYMDSLLNNHIRNMLREQFSQQFGANNNRLSECFEVSIIELFNKICNQKREEIERLQVDINNLTSEKEQRDLTIKNIYEKCTFYQKMEVQYTKIQQKNKQLLVKQQQLMIVQKKMKIMEQRILEDQKELQKLPLLIQIASEYDQIKLQCSRLNELIQQKNEQNERLISLGSQLKKTVQQLQQKSISLKIATQQMTNLSIQVQQLKKLKEKATVLTQTDQILPQVYSCSLIKKQFINQSNGRIQTEQSSFRICSSFENKENIPIADSSQKLALTISQKQSYKQKIFTLNEIINYLINYAKGYSDDNIRKGSWFYSRISLNGEDYQKKLMNPQHLEPKRINIKFIRQLVKKDNNCAKLIKEFQSIINFYCQQTLKQYSNTNIDILFEQQKLNKTVIKFKNQGNHNIPHLL